MSAQGHEPSYNSLSSGRLLPRAWQPFDRIFSDNCILTVSYCGEQSFVPCTRDGRQSARSGPGLAETSADKIGMLDHWADSANSRRHDGSLPISSQGPSSQYHRRDPQRDQAQACPAPRHGAVGSDLLRQHKEGDAGDPH